MSHLPWDTMATVTCDQTMTSSFDDEIALAKIKSQLIELIKFDSMFSDQLSHLNKIIQELTVGGLQQITETRTQGC